MEKDEFSWIFDFDLSDHINQKNTRIIESLKSMYGNGYNNVLHKVLSWIDYFDDPYICFDKDEDHTKWFIVWQIRNWLPASEKSLEVYFYPENKTILLNRIFQESWERGKWLLTTLLCNLYSFWNELGYETITSVTNTKKNSNFSFVAQSKLWFLLEEKYFDRVKKEIHKKYEYIKPWIIKYHSEIDTQEIDHLIYDEMRTSFCPKILWKIVDLPQVINSDEEFITHIYWERFSKVRFQRLRFYEKRAWLAEAHIENEIMLSDHAPEKGLTLWDFLAYNLRVWWLYDLKDLDVKQRMEKRFNKRWLIPTSTSSPSSISQV